MLTLPFSRVNIKVKINQKIIKETKHNIIRTPSAPSSHLAAPGREQINPRRLYENTGLQNNERANAFTIVDPEMFLFLKPAGFCINCSTCFNSDD